MGRTHLVDLKKVGFPQSCFLSFTILHWIWSTLRWYLWNFGNFIQLFKIFYVQLTKHRENVTPANNFTSDLAHLEKKLGVFKILYDIYSGFQTFMGGHMIVWPPIILSWGGHRPLPPTPGYAPDHKNHYFNLEACFYYRVFLFIFPIFD